MPAAVYVVLVHWRRIKYADRSKLRDNIRVVRLRYGLNHLSCEPDVTRYAKKLSGGVGDARDDVVVRVAAAETTAIRARGACGGLIGHTVLRGAIAAGKASRAASSR